MHVIFIPYSLMKVDPASWMKMVTKYKGRLLQNFAVQACVFTCLTFRNVKYNYDYEKSNIVFHDKSVNIFL